MSQNKDDKPQTANQNHQQNKPDKGRVFVRNASGTASLKQTQDLFKDKGGKK